MSRSRRYNGRMADEAPQQTAPPPPDDGLRRMLTWTFIALVLSVVAAMIGVNLVMRYFQ